MKRIDADAFVPITSSHSVSVNGFGGGDPTVPTNPTEIDEIWLNGIQEEIASVIDEAHAQFTGHPVDGASFNQLLQALVALFVTTYSNQAAIGGDKNFTGNVSVQGNVVADNGSHILGGTLQVDGDLTVVNNLTATIGTTSLGATTLASAHVSGNDHVSGNEQIDGTCTVTGAINANGGIAMAAPTTIASMASGFLNGFADGHALGGAVPGAWKDAQGMKHIQGGLSHSGAGSGSPVKAFTLDAPFKPLTDKLIVLANSGGTFGANDHVLVSILANGDAFVTYSTGAASALVYLDGIPPYL